MKHALIYLSKTGHSRKIAKAIEARLDIPAQDVRENPSWEQIDLLLIVGGIYGGQSLPALTDYVKSIDGKTVTRAALITSCTTGKNRQDAVREILSAKGIPVADEFVCRGSFLVMGLGRPNQTELDDAVRFVENLL